MSGGGSSQVCAGGPPNYCARTDQAMQYITFPNLPAHDPYDSGPPVGRVFIMPDFGARVMRVTDEMSVIGNTKANEAYTAYDTSSNDGYAGFSAFNSALGTKGGYYFAFGSWKGYAYVDMFDPATMQVTPYISPTYGLTMPYFSFSWNDANVGFLITGGVSNLQLDAYCFSTASPSDPWCQSPGPDGVSGSNGQNLIYNFAKSCPNFPTDIDGTYSAGVIAASRDDTKFAFYFGGVSHDYTKYVFYYDKTTNTCRWLDAIDGVEGGTGESPTHISNVQLPNPVAAPVPVASATGGNLSGPATYCVKYTVLTGAIGQDGSFPAGETLPSPEACVSMPSTSTGSITTTWASAGANNPNSLPWATQFGATGNYSIYIGIGSGSEKLQAKEISSGYVQKAALNTTSAAPPSASTAGFSVHYAQVNLGSIDGLGPAVYIQAANDTASSPVWFPASNTVQWCVSACAGHNVVGYRTMVNGPDDYGSQMFTRPYSALGSQTEVTSQPPCKSNCGPSSHWAWQADNPADTAPVFAGLYNSGNMPGNGTVNESPSSNVNPAFQVDGVYQREAMAISPVDGTTYRFIHNPTTAACNDNDNPAGQNCFYGEGQAIESPDGKWLLMTSNWDFRLGTYLGGSCPNKSCAWIAGGSVSSGSKILDSNGNVETAQSSGTMGSSQPAWPATIGGTVVDNTVTWKMSAGCPSAGQCRADLFLVELR